MHREILGVEVTSAEDGAGWLAFLRRLVARGLTGVRLVISDAHRGLVEAIGATLLGAVWRRCRTHYLRNLLTKVPRSAQPWVATPVRTVSDQRPPKRSTPSNVRVVDSLAAKHPDAASTWTKPGLACLPAFTGFPRQIWSNNPKERLSKEIRRRTDVAGIFPDRTAIVRLVGAVLMEQTDEWAEARRYMGLEFLAKARLHVIEDTTLDPEIDRRELTA